ncbi:MAG: histidine phosphatase family protein [Bacteroidota bacterium]|nr:histidine phosphatase family protein [Bacteroidota bacterium]
MKKLLLIRHAKAEKDNAPKDIDRPLKYIGIQDAAFMADRLKDNSIIPEYILTSPALRAKTTAEIFADQFSLPEPALDKNIYEASEKTLLRMINKLSNEHNFIALVGHNPGIAYILLNLTGQVRDVHTCTVAMVEFDTDDWAEVSSGTGKLTYYSSPKE